jgi:hypothetical protein
MINWVTFFTMGLPSIVLMIVEAGRTSTTRGPVRYPALILLLGQYIGLSIAFSAVWVPSFIWGRRIERRTSSQDDGGGSLLSYQRAFMSRYCIVPPLVLTILIFTVHPSTYAWTVAAGLLGGPALALLPLPYWYMDGRKRKHKLPFSSSSSSSSSQDLDDAAAEVSKVRSALITSYSISGMVAFLLWIVVLIVVVQTYGFDFGAIRRDLWIDAHGFVRFMMIDSVIIYCGLLSYIGYLRTTSVPETLLQTLLVGPGASIAATLASLVLEEEHSDSSSDENATVAAEKAGTASAPAPKKDN